MAIDLKEVYVHLMTEGARVEPPDDSLSGSVHQYPWPRPEAFAQCVAECDRALLVEIDRDAVIHHEDAARVDAHTLRHRSIRHQVSPLSVNGHDEARFHQVVDEAQLPGGRVPGNVHQSISFVHHRRAEFGQAIDYSINRVFVSRDQ